jgi:xanthine/uracil permease
VQPTRPALYCRFLSFLSSLPQNNGVISLTGVASRWAGWGCAFWLILFGIIGKTGGLVLSIPHCVLGGATTFLFAAGA